jgi:hypothetical protein
MYFGGSAIGFEVLTPVVMKSSIVRDSTDVSEEHVASIFMVEE